MLGAELRASGIPHMSNDLTPSIGPIFDRRGSQDRRKGERREALLPDQLQQARGKRLDSGQANLLSTERRRCGRDERRPRAVRSGEMDGGRDRDRTCDPYHVKVVLYR